MTDVMVDSGRMDGQRGQRGGLVGQRGRRFHRDLWSRRRGHRGLSVARRPNWLATRRIAPIILFAGFVLCIVENSHGAGLLAGGLLGVAAAAISARTTWEVEANRLRN